MPPFAAALLLLPLALACSTHLPTAGVNAFHRCDYAKAEEIFRSKAKAGDKDVVLYNLATLSSALRAGDDAVAERAALDAQKVMWSDAGKGRGTASLVSAEALKVFKGEPFEKSMAALYVGIIYYNRGELDNARAMFNKALLAVKTKEEAREDFALPFLLLAKAAVKEGDVDNAKIAIQKMGIDDATEQKSILDQLKKSNALFLVEFGHAPNKTRTGPGDSLIEWARASYPERSASISIDGASLGRAREVGDLTHQARTKGWTGKDTVQATKGVARDAAIVTTVIAAGEAQRGNKTAGWVALGSGLFAIANQSQADTRQWTLLPDLFAALPANLPSGRRQVRVQFFGEGGGALPGYDQVWYYDVAPGDDRIYLLHSGRCR